MDDPLLGTTLQHYRIVGRLGAGGMGVVYRATDEKLRRDVALKVLPEDLTRDDERRRRFLREARAAAAISHPNIATVHAVDEDGGRGFLVMELVEGETLRARLSAGALPLADARRIAIAIARGLERAHDKGIVHRDLKPENVMLGRHGEVKILDFGLAKLRSEAHGALEHQTTESHLTGEGRILGTPSYMSPEQALGSEVDARSDLFSLGVTLYEMATGVRPFEGATVGAVMSALVRDEPVAPSRHNPRVEPGLERAILRCLRKKAEDRFDSAQDLLQSLEASGAEPVRVRGRAKVAAALALAVTAAAGAVLVGRARTPSVEVGPARQPASAPSAAAPAPAATRIVDLPLPATRVPEAASEYAAGLQAMHDDSWWTAAAHFTKAVELDPSMALAHLRRSMSMLPTGDPATRRTAFERAAGLRARLGERDQALLEALQPFLQNQTQDPAETERRLRALAQRYPLDAEIWTWLGTVHYAVPEGLAPAERALALDPGDGQSWENKGLALLSMGRTDEARAAFERCGGLSVDGADCFLWLAWTDGVSGRCEEYARDAQRAADRSDFYRWLVVWSMPSRGASAAAIEEAVAQAKSALPAALGPEVQAAGMAVRVAILGGDFDRARGLASRLSAALTADPVLGSTYGAHYQLTAQLLDIALETGDDAAVARHARDFVARSGAWTTEVSQGHGVDLSLYFARLAAAGGDAQGPEFEARRRAWIDERLAGGAYRGDVWTYALAAPALTAVEARAALEALPAMGPTPPGPSLSWTFSGRLGSPEAFAGHAYLLAGRVDEALPHLRRAVAACDLFSSTIDHVRAELDLGRALEQKADRAGACEAYGDVLARWGHARPRSVTADAARARSTALGCEH